MDVTHWQSNLVSYKPGLDHLSCGLRLTLDLKCFVCSEADQAFATRELSPKEVGEGRPYNHHHGDLSWFKFLVDSRLAKQRHCPKCGTASIIPPAQQLELIHDCDKALGVEHLQQLVRSMNFSIIKVPETFSRQSYDAYRATSHTRDGIVIVSRDFSFVDAS